MPNNIDCQCESGYQVGPTGFIFFFFLSFFLKKNKTKIFKKIVVPLVLMDIIKSFFHSFILPFFLFLPTK